MEENKITKEVNEAFEIFIDEFEDITDCFYNSYLSVRIADK